MVMYTMASGSNFGVAYLWDLCILQESNGRIRNRSIQANISIVYLKLPPSTFLLCCGKGLEAAARWISARLISLASSTIWYLKSTLANSSSMASMKMFKNSGRQLYSFRFYGLM